MGGGPSAVVKESCLLWKIASSNPPLAFKFQRNKMFLPRSLVMIQYRGEPPWPRGSVLGLRPPGLEFFVWRTVSSHSSHHPQVVLLAQFSLYVHKGGLKPHSFHFIYYYQMTSVLSSSLNDIIWKVLNNLCMENNNDKYPTRPRFEPSVPMNPQPLWNQMSHRDRPLAPRSIICCDSTYTVRATIFNPLTITARGSTLVVSIWRL